MSSVTDPGFFIREINVEKNYVLVVPYLTTFKNSKDMYPSINIALTHLDTDSDLHTQIAAICKPFIDNIILQETTNHTSNIASMLNNSIDTVITVSTSAVEQYKESLLPEPTINKLGTINFVV